MSLSRDQAEKNGLKFSIEGEARPEAPDQEIWQADLTIDGHTLQFAGKSEEEVLQQAERTLLSRGRLKSEKDEAGEPDLAVAQESDVEALGDFREIVSGEAETFGIPHVGAAEENDEELQKKADGR